MASKLFDLCAAVRHIRMQQFFGFVVGMSHKAFGSLRKLVRTGGPWQLNSPPFILGHPNRSAMLASNMSLAAIRFQSFWVFKGYPQNLERLETDVRGQAWDPCVSLFGGFKHHLLFGP